MLYSGIAVVQRILWHHIACRWALAAVATYSEVLVYEATVHATYVDRLKETLR
jgi:hypothetical protein